MMVAQTPVVKLPITVQRRSSKNMMILLNMLFFIKKITSERRVSSVNSTGRSSLMLKRFKNHNIITRMKCFISMVLYIASISVTNSHTYVKGLTKSILSSTNTWSLFLTHGGICTLSFCIFNEVVQWFTKVLGQRYNIWQESVDRSRNQHIKYFRVNIVFGVEYIFPVRYVFFLRGSWRWAGRLACWNTRGPYTRGNIIPKIPSCHAHIRNSLLARTAGVASMSMTRRPQTSNSCSYPVNVPCVTLANRISLLKCTLWNLHFWLTNIWPSQLSLIYYSQ